MEYSVMDQYWIWLSAVEGVGPRRFYQILSLFTDPRDVWENVRDKRLEFLGPKVLASLRKARDERFFFDRIGQPLRAEIARFQMLKLFRREN